MKRKIYSISNLFEFNIAFWLITLRVETTSFEMWRIVRILFQQHNSTLFGFSVNKQI